WHPAPVSGRCGGTLAAAAVGAGVKALLSIIGCFAEAPAWPIPRSSAQSGDVWRDAGEVRGVQHVRGAVAVLVRALRVVLGGLGLPWLVSRWGRPSMSSVNRRRFVVGGLAGVAGVAFDPLGLRGGGAVEARAGGCALPGRV